MLPRNTHHETCTNFRTKEHCEPKEAYEALCLEPRIPGFEFKISLRSSTIGTQHYQAQTAGSLMIPYFPFDPTMYPTTITPPSGTGRALTPATQVFPRFNLLLPGEPVCTDIEFQLYHIDGETYPRRREDGRRHLKGGKERWRNRLGWICITNTKGELILDCFVQYPEDPKLKVKMAPEKYGVTAARLKAENGAVDATTVERWCMAIFANRPVVLHGGVNDLTSFYYGDAFAGATEVFDTQKYWPGTMKLCDLARVLLEEDVQQGGYHTAVEDTVTTMRIYMLTHSFNREMIQATFEALIGEVKEAYWAGFPRLEEEHYQDNIVPGV
ncbi:hypothetical protein DOTSEDRAFT_28451 [Dothistroma septosporum NZE10]|uniref:Exonuclease domain-containing protein n=1 Tax=Dothistroma septosporum (strain NZE10 / CBS 128990) TaxID=675120 RepID=M2YK02_DOTSN|nr:hypothetical protein DOTSEDRAFT_28451 [Dothistroma septosporum NZE10]